MSAAEIFPTPANADDVHILVVDDDEIDVRCIQREFAKQRLANPLHVAHDGLEGLAMLRGEGDHEPIPRPSLVLLDLNMPRLDGLGFLEELRRDPTLHDTIVFVLTTSDADEDKVACYRHHIAGYLVKSDAGRTFLSMIQMLERFVVSIRFPPAS